MTSSGRGRTQPREVSAAYSASEPARLWSEPKYSRTNALEAGTDDRHERAGGREEGFGIIGVSSADGWLAGWI